MQHTPNDPDCTCKACEAEAIAYAAHCEANPDPDPCFEDYPGQNITGPEDSE